jgi:hypothetical protein
VQEIERLQEENRQLQAKVGFACQHTWISVGTAFSKLAITKHLRGWRRLGLSSAISIAFATPIDQCTCWPHLLTSTLVLTLDQA